MNSPFSPVRCWLLALAIFCGLSLSLSADQFGDFTYTSNGSAITITAYTGAGGGITLPSTIISLPVTTIGSGAFIDNTSITSVVIPASVTSIGSSAFSRCTRLTSITVEAANPNYSSLDGVLFNKALTTLMQYPCQKAGTYTISASVTSIQSLAFSRCDVLTAITVEGANPNYSSLDGVLFNKARTTLIQYPGGKPGDYSIPASVTSIGTYAFSFCNGLTSIIIHASVTSIGSYAFSWCGGLRAITVDAANPNYSSLDGVLFSKAMTKLIQYPGAKAGAYSIPASVTNIGIYAFSWYTGLMTSVDIPAGVTNIESSAFWGCTGLKTAFFAGNAPTMGSSVFASTASGFTVYYLSGKTGFTSPTWQGYPAVELSPGPEILTHPASVDIVSGATATLTVAALGAEPLSYQWYQGTGGDTTMPVGTNSARFTTPALTNTTFYWVKVGNAANPTGVKANTATVIVRPEVTPSLANPNFDPPVEDVSDNGANGQGSISAWNRSKTGIGINNLAQPFLNQDAHSYDSVAFIQQSGNISQVLAGFDPSKLYSVTYFVSERGYTPAGGTAPVTSTSVSLDGGTTSFAQADRIRKTDKFRRIVSGPLSVSGTSSTLQVTATGVAGDNSLLIDTVSVTRVVPRVPDNGFENPVQPGTGTAGFEQANGTGDGTLAGSLWNFGTNLNGIMRNGSPYSALSADYAPEGSQAAMLLGIGEFSTTVSGFEPGVTYSLSFTAKGRGTSGSPNTIQIQLGEQILTFAGANSATPSQYFWTTYTTDPFTTNGGNFNLKFVGVTAGDKTSFIDDIRFDFLAEDLPTIYPASQTISSGATATLSVVAIGTAPFTYQWYQGESGTTTTPVGTNSNSFTTPPLTLTTSYWVKITNAANPAGADSNTATVAVNQPAGIATHPASITINSGATTTLTVTASGTAPFSYQWYQGASGTTTIPVGSNSSSFTTPALTSTTSYWVKVTNAANPAGADSNTVAVTIASPVSNFTYTSSGSAITITGYTGADAVVNIPATISSLPVTSVGNNAFRFKNIRSVVIPNGVTSIGNYAFEGCAILASVTIPASARTIGSFAFYHCANLTGITIPSGVASIGYNAFDSCANLTGIAIPASVTSIGMNAFNGCTALTAITVDAANPNYSSLDGVLFNKTQTTLIRYPEAMSGAYSVPSGVTTITNWAFAGCDSVTSVVIGAGVTSIGDSVFRYCSGLTSVTIPDGLTSIGNSAFQQCANLSGIVIPPAVTSIGSYAFLSCNRLSSIALSTNVSSIGRSAFSDCQALTTISVSPANPNYSSTDGVMFDKLSTALIQCPAGKAGTYTIPGTVTAIQEDAFYGCRSLTNVTIPSGVTSIRSRAFLRCSGLAGIVIPEGITTIEQDTFQGCSGLVNVAIPANVSSIGIAAFAECSALAKATFLGNAPTMGPNVFSSTASGFKVCYYDGRSGFTTPTWQGYPSEVLASPVAIATHPASTTINSGATTTLTVTASGTEPVTYQWYQGAPGTTTTPEGTNSASFTTPALTTTTSYWVKVTNAANPTGASSSAATVTVIAPEIALEQPLGTDLSDGGSRNFGVVAVGSNASLTFTIKNAGDADLTGLAITKDGPHAADFTVTVDPVAPVSGPSGSTSFTVSFSPIASGTRTASIHIASNDADESPFDINLTGTGSASTAKDILTFVFPGLPATITAGSNISVTMPYGTNVKALAPTYTVSPSAAGVPASGSARNFTTPQTYTITAQDGSTKVYTVTVTVAASSIVDNFLASDNPAAGSLWSFGYYTSDSETSFKLFTTPNQSDGLYGWGDSTYETLGTPGAVRNTSGNTHWAGVPAGAVALHPGPAVGATLVRDATAAVFTSTTAGFYEWTAVFGAGDSGAVDVEVGVYRPSTTAFESGFLMTGQVSDIGGVGNVWLASGDQIVFRVGNSGSFYGDTTPLQATVRAVEMTQSADILTFGLPGNPAFITGTNISLTVPYGTNVTALAPAFTLSPGATCDHVSGTAYDFTNPVIYTVTSSDFSTTKSYTVTINQPAVIATHPASITINSGSTTTLTVTASGAAPLTYQWYQGPSGTTTTPVGTNSATFTTPALTTTTPYWVKVTNAANPTGADSNTATVTVTAPEIVVEQPVGTALTSGTSTVDFGSGPVGVPRPLAFTIKNTGNAPLTDIAVTTDGANSADFALTTASAASLAAGDSTTMVVTFTPSAVGARTAAIHVTSNDNPSRNPFHVNLTGMGIVTGTAYFWTGTGGDNLWNNPANWAPAGIPGVGGTAFIPDGASVIAVENTFVDSINQGVLQVADDRHLRLAGTITNSGTILLDANNARVGVDNGLGNATLTGGGVLRLAADSARITAIGNANATLTNQDNTISGFGYINSNLYFVNNGTVNADVSGKGLSIYAPTSGSGTYTSSNDGTLVIASDLTGGIFSGPATGGWVGASNGTLIDSMNQGTFHVADDRHLRLAGTITNSGTILLDANNARVGVDNGLGNATLTGGGVLRLAADSARIEAIGNANATLTNQDNTIRGFGYINSNLYFVNNGAVNADVSGKGLGIYAPTSGSGTYTASNEGTLVIASDLTGGIFSGPATGGWVGASNGTLIDSMNQGTFHVADDRHLRLAGTITNSGTILLDANNARAGVDNGLANATLTGGGVVRLAADSARIEAIGNANATLTNQDNTIRGFGYINSNLYFVNNGAVNADVSGKGLGIYAPTSGSGTYTASNEGTLVIASDLTGGIFSGPATGGWVGASNGTLIDSMNQGTFHVADDRHLRLAGTITNSGTILLDANNARAGVDNGLANATLTGGGVVRLAADSARIEAIGNANATLTNQDNTIRGFGSIQSNLYFVNNGAVNADVSGKGLGIYAPTSGSGTYTASNDGTLVIASDLTGGIFSGPATGGWVGASNGTLIDSINQGTFHVADDRHLRLAGTITNSGTILLDANNARAGVDNGLAHATLTGGGVLRLAADSARIEGLFNANGILTNQDNTIRGFGSIQSNLYFVNNGAVNADVSGKGLGIYAPTSGSGTYTASNDGTLVIASDLTGGIFSGPATGGWVGASNGTLIDSINQGTFHVADDRHLRLAGTITNSGTILLDANNARAGVDNGLAHATLTGGGVLRLAADSARIEGLFNANGILTNQDNTISGFGSIQSNLYFVNNGTVNADVSGKGLGIYAPTSGSGTYTASNDGTLVIASDLTGGIFSGPATGGWVGASNGTLIDSINQGTFHVADDRHLRLAGTITNSGTILLDANNARAGVDNGLGHAALTGGGVVRLAADSARITAIGNANATLTNQDNTISGFGYINSDINFVNNGAVNADVSGRTLSVHTSNFVNTGTMAASNGGYLYLPGGYTQTSGVTLVANSSTIITGNGSNFGAIQIAGGRLEGSGTVGANVTIADTISPGNSVGALAIGGDLTLTNFAKLQIELGGLTQGTQYDFLSEAGSVPLTLAGTLNINFTNDFQLTIQPTDVFTILSSNSTILGAFANMVGGRIATADSHGTLALSLVDNSVVLSDFLPADETPPTITAQPLAAQTVAANASVILTVAASGYPVPTFQWYQGGSGDTLSVVDGATSASFTTPALTASTSYWARATNAHGVADSAAASITVELPPAVNANLAGLAPQFGELSPAFDPAVVTYQLRLPHEAEGIAFTPTVAAAGAMVKVNGETVASGALSSEQPLRVGSNPVSFVVTSPDVGAFRTYTVTVTRAAALAVATIPAVVEGSTAAWLKGTLVPNGTVGAYFEYGPTVSYGSRTETMEYSGETMTDLKVRVTGLIGNHTYHFRAVASGEAGLVHGEDMMFATAAEAPLAATGKPVTTGATTATLIAAVDPRGQTTAVVFEFGLGTTYGRVTTPQSLAASAGLTDVWVPVTDLIPNVNYHCRVVATNAAGVSHGENVMFLVRADGGTVPGCPFAVPTVATGAAAGITTTGALILGEATANGGTTLAHIEYGTTTNYGRTTPPLGAGGGDTVTALTIPLDNLLPGTLYHYRVVASNSMGNGIGNDRVFTTRYPAPAVVTGAADVLSSTKARVSGTVRARGADSEVWVDYGTDGVAFPFSVRTTPSTVTGDDTTAVTADLAGLSQGATYHYRVRAISSGGTAMGGVRDFSVARLSGLIQEFPDAVPLAGRQGMVTVNLTPTGIVSGWRLSGEQVWRAPGTTAAGLVAGERVIEYRPVPGMEQPSSETVSVASDATPMVLDRIYQSAARPATGRLTVTLKPRHLAEAVEHGVRLQWRLAGDATAPWLDSGATLEALAPGNHLVECREVPDRVAPELVTAVIANGHTTSLVITYQRPPALVGAPPAVLDFATVSGSYDRPYAYVGQIRNEKGSGSGFVVRPGVVASAGHVVFDDGTLALAGGIEWLFQRDRGAHEPQAMRPRGIYLMTGYAAQRALDNSPGQATAQSQALDVAALYFLTDPGRGGYSGYLASDSRENEFLMSPAMKTLAGYPVSGVVPADRDRMFATDPAAMAFAPALGQTYVTRDVRGFGGCSGGPVCVRFENGNFYPAAIYLGGSEQAVVRAIDGAVADLFGFAENSAMTGGIGTGGLLTQSATTPVPSANGSLLVQIEPAAARSAGAGWRLRAQAPFSASGAREDDLEPNTYAVEFATVAGYVPPSRPSVRIQAGALGMITFTYEKIVVPPVITSPDGATGPRGQLLTYQLSALNDPDSFHLQGALPDGMTFEAANGRISGVPSLAGNFVVTVGATNRSGSVSRNVAITSLPLIADQTHASPVGRPFDYQITSSESGAGLTFTADGLPAGLALDTLTGRISGSPATAGSFVVRVSVTVRSATAPANLTLHITDRAPTVVSQPVAQSVAYGGTALLGVEVDGSPVPAYQWYEGGAGDTSRPVAGAKSAALTTWPLVADTRFWVRATNISGSVDSESVQITVLPSEHPNLAAIIPGAGNLEPGFSPGVTDYVLAVPHGVESLSLTVQAEVPQTTVRIQGAAVALGVPSPAIALGIGETRITVTSTAGNGTAMKTYTVTVTRSPAAVLATGDALHVSDHGATVTGTVTPHGMIGAFFEFGISKAYGNATSPQEFSGAGPVAIEAALDGLAGSTAYHYRLVAVTPYGNLTGQDRVFTTTLDQPVAATGDAAGVGTASAKLVGAVATNGLPTTVYFQLGEPPAYGTRTPDQAVPAGAGVTDVFQQMTGLLEGATYHYRFVATNETGTVFGEDVTFVAVTGGGGTGNGTPSAAPSVSTGSATDVGTAAAVLTAIVNPNLGTTLVHFEYGLTTAYGFTTAAKGVGRGDEPVDIAFPVSGLEPGRTYHFRVVAENSDGSVAGNDATFLTGSLPPEVVTGSAEPISPASARVNATVRARGAEVAVFFDYGTNGTAFPFSVAADPATVSGTDDIRVSATLGNLDPKTTYYFRVRAVRAPSEVTGIAAALKTGALEGLKQGTATELASSERKGRLTVSLMPDSVAEAGWRFTGETTWRESGTTATGLATGEREVEYRPVGDHIQPEREMVSVISGGSPVVIERFYYRAARTGTASIRVTLLPTGAVGARWRLAGESASAWKTSGTLRDGMMAGTYLVECAAVSGWEQPAVLSVEVGAGDTRALTMVYQAATAPNLNPPKVVGFNTANANDEVPYRMVGQVRGLAGGQSGFAARKRVVATAAQAVFDEATLSIVPDLQWLSQRDGSNYEPEPVNPRGMYVFDGYANQRAAEATPGVLGMASLNLNVAALYFTSDAARGGYTGFLASDASANPHMATGLKKILIGYPVAGISPERIGRMHATPASTSGLTRATGSTFVSSGLNGIRGFTGMAGGPLCVKKSGSAYQPAGIYVGGTDSGVYRAIDSEVVDLFSRAEISSNGGDNHTGGGITHSSFTDVGSAGQPGALIVRIEPAAAITAGAGWLLAPETSFRQSGAQKNGLTAGDYQLQLRTVSGFLPPAQSAVTIREGQVTSVTFTYQADIAPPALAGADGTTATRGYPLVYQIAASGNPTGFSLDGVLPAGIVFNPANGLISGTPDEVGVFPVTIGAANEGGSVTRGITLTSKPSLPDQRLTAPLGSPVSYQLRCSESGPGTAFAAIGLPAGITLDPATGTLSGTPGSIGETVCSISVTKGGVTTPALLTVAVVPTPLQSWRLANFGTTENTGPAADTADPDGDGQVNLAEYTAGTGPNDPADVFRVLSTTKTATSFTVTASGKAGRSYVLEQNPALSGGAWKEVAGSGVLTSGGTVTLTDATPPDGGAFYRVRVVLP